MAEFWDSTLSTDVSKVRLAIGDTTEAGHLLEDATITSIIAMYPGDLTQAISDCFDAAISSASKEFDYKSGADQEWRSQKVAQLKDARAAFVQTAFFRNLDTYWSE